ncbi:immunomodulatory protein [Desarmillaria ectypa]|nr:immunomodulatory protein [Desarmillaria ectypa]
MKFLSSLALALIPTCAMAATAGYDNGYGVGTNSLRHVACSDGSHGLLTKGYTTYSSLPSFPYIASSSAVETYNSANCGTCWNLTYTGLGEPRNITVLAVDHADSGFYTSLDAFNNLTDGHAVEYGIVDVTAVQVNVTYCGL